MIISSALAAVSEGAHHSEPLIQSAEFWLTVTFAIVFLIAVRPLVRGFNMVMTVRAAKIKKSLVDAKVLRTDTEQLLEEYLKKQENVEQEVNNIVSDAKKHAEEIRKTAEESLKESMKNKEKSAMANIALLETMAMSEMRQKIAEVTMTVAKQTVEGAMSAHVDDKIMAKFSTNLSDRLDEVPDLKN